MCSYVWASVVFVVTCLSFLLSISLSVDPINPCKMWRILKDFLNRLLLLAVILNSIILFVTCFFCSPKN
jgi:hypothetical protein